MKVSSVITKVTQIGILSVGLAQSALAAPTSLGEGVTAAQPEGASDQLFGGGGIFQTIADTLIYLVGAIAVIMLILGGLKYVTSQGNKESVQGAKDTILHAIIGIVVAILAFAAVRFVSDQF